MSTFFYYIGVVVGLIGLGLIVMGIINVIKSKGRQSDIRDSAVLTGIGSFLLLVVSNIIISISK